MKKKKFPALRIASWNVRTMCLGFTDDLQQIDDARKKAVIDRERSRLNMEIAALRETKLAESGSLREQNYTFVWQGKAQEETSEHGMGFAMKKYAA